VFNIIVVVGAGAIGQAIARRVSAGKRVLLADLRRQNAEAAAIILNTSVVRRAERGTRNDAHR
jgi:3-hydroxyacyl-CoA dehydrogenase